MKNPRKIGGNEWKCRRPDLNRESAETVKKNE